MDSLQTESCSSTVHFLAQTWSLTHESLTHLEPGFQSGGKKRRIIQATVLPFKCRKWIYCSGDLKLYDMLGSGRSWTHCFTLMHCCGVVSPTLSSLLCVITSNYKTRWIDWDGRLVYFWVREDRKLLITMWGGLGKPVVCVCEGKKNKILTRIWPKLGFHAISGSRNHKYTACMIITLWVFFKN